jgi:hypothetical protein
MDVRPLRLLWTVAALALLAIGCGRSSRPDDSATRDGEFTAARREIEASADDFAKLDALIAKSRAKCLSDGTSLDLFRWAYATVKRCRNDYDHYQSVCRSEEVRRPAKLFAQFANVDDDQFQRVRFLYTVNFESSNDGMAALGDRLLDKAPRDAPVMLGLLKMCRPDTDEPDRVKGLALVSKLDAQLPYDFSVLRTTSYFYYLSWMRTHNAGEARESIRRAEEALKLCRSETQKKLLQKRIDEVQAWLDVAKP